LDLESQHKSTICEVRIYYLMKYCSVIMYLRFHALTMPRTMAGRDSSGIAIN
jgi:hypothetical protein